MSLLQRYLTERAVMKSIMSAPVKANPINKAENKIEIGEMFGSKFNDKKKILTIYYLFMSVDSSLTDVQKESFTKLCEVMGATAEEVAKATKYCQRIIPKSDVEDYSNRITLRILETLGWVKTDENGMHILDEDKSGTLSFTNNSFFESYNKSDYLNFVWTLINLSYVDGECTAAEENIISIIADSLKIEDTIFNDLKDTAQTMYMLYNQKDWLKTTNKPYDDVTRELSKIDGQIAILVKNIENILSDEDIA